MKNWRKKMNKKTFRKKLFMLATMCKEELKAEIAEMYEFSLEKYGWDKVCVVLDDFFLSARPYKFPVIADFVDKLSPPIKEKSEAMDIALRVKSAISKFGASNAEKAQNYIGEVGWYCVERWGGWKEICENLHVDQEHLFVAQFRDLAISIIEKSKQGRLELAPKFADFQIKGKLKQLTEKVKEIE